MKKIARFLGIIVLVFLVICFVYVSDYYKCDDPIAAVESDETVTVTAIDEGWFFDGPGDEEALIFYPGAKVQPESYSDIMRGVAAGGVDCFLVKMPGNMAMLGISKALSVEEDYDYQKWYLAGHSLGGAMAASFAEKHPEAIDGLIFLAAYSANDLTKADFPVLSVYGSNDKVLSYEKVEAGRAMVPKAYSEAAIGGGNHAGFGDYGPQKGDGEAEIDRDEQQADTVKLILDFVEAYS